LMNAHSIAVVEKNERYWFVSRREKDTKWT
jgi:hypothetical protein